MNNLIPNFRRHWFTGLFFFVLSLAALFFAFVNPASKLAAQTPSAPIYTAGSFTFSTPLALVHPPLNNPLLKDQDVEPEIKTDIWGNIYVTAIHGTPGGVDLWKSIDKGATFVYLGEPDGAQDKCNVAGEPLCTAGLGGGDDSIDVSSGGYLYVSSLFGAPLVGGLPPTTSVTMSVSYDGGAGGVLPGQKWEVNPASNGIPIDDRQWIAAYGPQTVYMTFDQAPVNTTIWFTKSTDAGKTWSAPTSLIPTGTLSRENNLAVDQYNGHIYTTYTPNGSPNQINLLRSTDGGGTWTTITAYTGPGGTSVENAFPIITVDRGGNLHVVFTRTNGAGRSNAHVFLISSSDAGATWTAPLQVDSGAANNSTVMPWAVAGSPGVVDITWYGSTMSSPNNTPTDQSQWWNVFFAQVTNALSASPTIAQNQVASKVHNLPICSAGGGCSGSTRDLAEYYAMTIDPDGNANITYTDEVNYCAAHPSTNCLAHVYYAKQTGGPSAYAPPAGPAAATFAQTIQLPNSADNLGEPSVAVDSHNCIYGSALGATFWASEDGGNTFRSTVDPPALGGGDEDLTTVPKQDGTRNDAIYYGDLLLADVDVFKSTDRGLTWTGTTAPYGHLNASSDRQWFTADRINAGANQIVWEMDHELASEDIRVAASIDDSVWGTTSGIATCSMPTVGCDPELATTIPNTNPGPIFINKLTHEAIGVFLASTITTNSADPPFGKEPNVWEFVASPPLTAGGPPTNVANYPIFKGVIDSPVTAPAGTTTYGSHAAAIFPSADADSAGNVYAVWSMISARADATIGANPATTWEIWFASSHDGGKTFYGPFKVSSSTGTAVFPWIAAGDAGKVDIVWYQSNNPTPPLVSDPTSPAELTGGPNQMPAGTTWNVMFAQSLNAGSREPSFTIAQISDNPNHRGNISIGGTTGSSDRSLADYFNVYIGPDGLANIMYTDNANATGTETSHIDFVRQNGGPVALTNPTFPTCLPIPVLTSVVSRKGHSTAGPFDISLPLPPSTSPRAVECRSGGATNDYQLVFSFTNNLTSVTGASVSSHNPASGTGTVSGSPIVGPNAPLGLSAKQCAVNLTNVSNAQYIRVTLTGVLDMANNSGDVVSPELGMLIGDVNATGGVDGNDVSAVQSHTRQTVSASTFRFDVNTTGAIDGNDVSATQSKTRTNLPSTP